MQINTNTQPSGLTQVSYNGEMTIFHIHDIWQHLLSQLAVTAELELDLSGISDIDSAGLQLLLAAKNAAKAQHKAFRLTAHSPAVVALLDISKLSGFFGDPILLPGETDRQGGGA